MSKRLHIAALGSSFAAGPGIEPIENVPAARSSNNYAHLLAQKLDAKLTDLTVSAATLLNVLGEPQEVRGSYTFPPQLALLPADADIVTLTGGGNDIGYVGAIFQDSFAAYIPSPLLWALQWWWPQLAVANTVTLEELTERFAKTLERIHEIAPKARVYVVEYLTILDADAKPKSRNLPLTAEQISRHRERAAMLEEATAKAAGARQDPGVQVVEVGKQSEGHGVGSTDPWMEGFSVTMLLRGKAPWHPNAEGHKAVADMLYERVQSGPPR